MKVLIVEPGQYPREADIEPTLEAKQKIVGGLIDVAYPFPDDNVCVVLNDEGKLMGLPLNRALGDYDVIAGTFFVCGYNEENFVGLTPEQFTRYEKFYHDPPDALWHFGRALHDGTLCCRDGCRFKTPASAQSTGPRKMNDLNSAKARSPLGCGPLFISTL